jgi:hypothetical protein
MGRGDWHLHRVPRVARLVALSLPASRSLQVPRTARSECVRRSRGGPSTIIVTGGCSGTAPAAARWRRDPGALRLRSGSPEPRRGAQDTIRLGRLREVGLPRARERSDRVESCRRRESDPHRGRTPRDSETECALRHAQCSLCHAERRRTIRDRFSSDTPSWRARGRGRFGVSHRPSA